MGSFPWHGWGAGTVTRLDVRPIDHMRQHDPEVKITIDVGGAPFDLVVFRTFTLPGNL